MPIPRFGLIFGRRPNGQSTQVAVDDLGQLLVVGAGVPAGSSQVQIVDGTDPLIKATVSGGRLHVDVEQDQPLTNAQLRATRVPVDVEHDQPLTDTQLRATPVNVETELIQPLTDAQLRLTPVNVETELSAGGPLALETTLNALLTRANLLAAEATLADVLAAITVLRDNQFRRTDPLAAGTSQIGSTIPDRPSQKPGRTYVTAVAHDQSGSSTPYTVTPGKTLYVTSIIFTGANAQTTGVGTIAIRDSTTVMVSIHLPPTIVGQAAVAIVFAPQLLEPLRFTTNVNLQHQAGTLRYGATFVGYEE